MRRGSAAAVFAATLVLAGCSSAGGPSSPPRASSPHAASTDAAPGPSSTPAPSTGQEPGQVPTPAHVVVVVFENKDASEVFDSSQAPYLTSLAAQGAALTDAHGVTHPSQPNYLALFSGSTQGLTDDSCPHTFGGANLGSELLAAGKTFAGYSEGLPSPGYTGCTAGDYARKHNPWVDFSSLPASVNQPLSAMPRDFSMLPTVSFVIPDLCNDMHDCSVHDGDDWARAHLADYVTWAQSHNSLLVVTFDEDEGSDGNGIATFLVGPMVRAGESDQYVDHYGILRTLEVMYGLDPLGQAADAQPLSGIWQSPTE